MHTNGNCFALLPSISAVLVGETPYTVFTEINMESKAVCRALNTEPHYTAFDSDEHSVYGSYLCRIFCCHGEGSLVCTCSNIHRCNCGKNDHTLFPHLSWTDTRWYLRQKRLRVKHCTIDMYFSIHGFKVSFYKRNPKCAKSQIMYDYFFNCHLFGSHLDHIISLQLLQAKQTPN